MSLERLVVFTFAGEGASLVSHAIAEGMQATLAIIEDMAEIHTDEEREAGGADEKPEEHRRRMATAKGLVPTMTADEAVKMLEAVPVAKRAKTFLFFDLNVCFRYAERLAGLGFPGNYPTQADRRLEADREAGKAFVERHYRGLKVAEHHEFDSADEGLAFLEKATDPWVLKGFSIDAPTVVPDTDDPKKAAIQLRGALERRRELYEDDGFLLEKKIPAVLEFTPQGVWYDGRLSYFSLDIELKRKGAGDTGLPVGCAGNLILPLSDVDRLVTAAFPPVVWKMATDHRGMFIWDASVLVDPKTGEFFYGEFCSNRAGYDSLFTEIDMAGGVRSYFEAVVTGRNPLQARAGFSVRIFNDHLDPDHAKMPQAELALGVEPIAAAHVWTMDARAGEGSVCSNGYVPDLAIVTGTGPDPAAAIAATYQTLAAGVSFEGASYRPEHDILATTYPGAIMNRVNYGLQHALFGTKTEEPVPSYFGAKDERMYQHIKDRLLAKGRSTKSAKREAAATTNKHRANVRKMVGHTGASR